MTGGSSYVVDTAQKFRAFAHPLRQDILAGLDDARSVTDVAVDLGVPPARLYHHFKLLEREGIIEVCGTRKVRSNDERLYRRVAEGVRFAPAVTGRREFREQLRAGVVELTEDLMAEFLRGAAAWEAGELAADVPVSVSRRTVALSESEAREVSEALSSAVAGILRRRRPSAARRTWIYAGFFFPEPPAEA